MRPTRGRVILAVLFALLAADAWRQVIFDGVLAVNEPRLLTALKAVAGTAALAAAWGSWRGARWAPVAAIAWGCAIAALLVALEPVLGLGHEARTGLWIQAVALLACSIGAAWYLGRSRSRIEAGERRPAAPGLGRRTGHAAP